MTVSKSSKYLTRLTSIILCGSMLVCNVMPVAASSKKKSNEDKVETVYVNASATGETEKITVSEQLKNKGQGDIEDYSSLKNIQNVKGDEEFTQDQDGKLTWVGAGDDICYQGESDEELPVSVKVTYFLDGKKVSPDKLAGKSGKVKIRFDYTNNTKDRVKVKDKEIDVQTPFTIVSAMILPSEHFSNIEVENGKVVSDGDRNVVIGMAMPGLKDSLKLKDYEKLNDIDIPDYVEVTADAEDFELDMTATMATTGLLSDMDLSDIDSFDDLKKDMDELTDASTKLKDGSDELLDGMKKLDDSLKTYTKGVDKVDDGAGKLKDALVKLADNKEAFEKGAEDLTSGLKTLKNGTKTIKNGIKDYTDGAASLEKGISSAASGSGALKSGASELTGGLKDYTDGVKQIQKGLSDIDSQMSKMNLPSDDQLSKVSQAASKLSEDAEKLQKILSEIQSTVNAVSNAHDNLESGVPALIKASQDAAQSQAKKQADDAVGKQTDKAKKAASDAIKDGEKKANDIIDDAAKDASSKTKDSIRDKVKGLRNDENKDVIDKVLNEIDEVSAKGTDKQVSLDSDVEIDSSGTDIKIDISGDSDVKSAKSKLEQIKVSDIDTGELKSLLGDMQTQAAVLKSFGQQVSKLSGSLPVLKEGIKDLSGGSKKLTSKNDNLNDGMKALYKGIKSLSEGLDTIEAGAKKLTSNNNTLTTGASDLDNGAEALLSGSKKLEIAIKKVTASSTLLATGAIKLKNGTYKLSSAGSEVRDGTGKLVDGTSELHDGIIKFDEEGIQEIAKLAGDDLDSVITQIKAVKKAGGRYQSYGGIKEGDKGSVKFVIETAAIEKDED